MSIKIPIETSARHLHISQEDFEKLFGEGSKPHFIKELSQPGQYYFFLLHRTATDHIK